MLLVTPAIHSGDSLDSTIFWLTFFPVSLLHSLNGVSGDHVLNKLPVLEGLSHGLLLGRCKLRQLDQVDEGFRREAASLGALITITRRISQVKTMQKQQD